MEASNRDDLTGLLNKTAINEHIENLFLGMKGKKTNGDRRFSLAFIDLDYFKTLNDKYGHLLCDQILIQAGKILIGNIGELGKAGRYGGDEFLLVFENAAFEETFIALENIRREIKSHSFEARIEDREMRTGMTCSIGMASFPKDGKDLREVMRAANEALYRAKKEGRDRIYIAIEEKKVPKTVYFTPRQIQRIAEIADNSDKTESELYREAADFLIDEYKMMSEMKDMRDRIGIHVGKKAMALVESANLKIEKGLIAAVKEARAKIHNKTGLRVMGIRIQDSDNIEENRISFVINNREIDSSEFDPGDPDVYPKMVKFVLDNLAKSILEI